MSRLARNLSIKVINRASGEERKLVLKKSTQETPLHISMKILAYIYFWKYDEVVIEPSYRFKRYKPDLLQLGPSPNPQDPEPMVNIWVECKTVKLEKLERLVRFLQGDPQIYWFHKTDKLKRILEPRMLRKYPKLKLVNAIGVQTHEWGKIFHELLDETSWNFIHKGDSLELWLGDNQYPLALHFEKITI